MNIGILSFAINFINYDLVYVLEFITYK